MSHRCAGTIAVLACLLAVAGRAEENPTISLQIPASKAATTTELPPPAGPDAASVAEGYFALGHWRIGMPREEALGKFGSVESLQDQARYRAVAQPHFAADVPSELTFADGKLQTVKLQLYDGTDLEEAVRRIQQPLLYMHEHFGGADFEGGIKTHKDPEGKLLLQVLRNALDSIEGGLRKTDEAERKKRKRKGQPDSYLAFEMVMNFGPAIATQNNFLMGEFRFRSDEHRIIASLYDDRAFVKSRIPEADVMLFRAKGQRPAPTSANPATATQ